MMADFHFLRPWWLLALVVLLTLVTILWQKAPRLHAWGDVCDSHLLDHLLQRKGQGKRLFSLSFLFLSCLFCIISLAGPAWYKFPVSTYKPIQPRVLVLDLSDNMLNTDLTPNRLSRAKFKLHDLLTRKDAGQFGLIVFTSEPFVVSPLTTDGKTIASLLPMLTSDIMPVSGQNLDTALTEASNLIKQAGYDQGQILVLTADTPSTASIDVAKKLADKGIFTSIMPVRSDKDLNPLFRRFATMGRGQVVEYTSDSSDLERWLAASERNQEFVLSKEDDVPLWRDEGRWFLIPALLFLLPVFQRGWLQRVAS